MRLQLCEGGDVFANEKDGQPRPRADSPAKGRADLSATDRIDRGASVTRINGQRISFRDLAKFAWPQKTDQFLSHLTGYDARTCRRWMANQTEPPAEALGAILQEIMRRFHVRS